MEGKIFKIGPEREHDEDDELGGPVSFEKYPESEKLPIVSEKPLDEMTIEELMVARDRVSLRAENLHDQRDNWIRGDAEKYEAYRKELHEIDVRLANLNKQAA
jgi:hypothetical protein